MGRGVFVTFEGPDGSGKSTQIKLLRDFLVGEGRDAVMAREPGGTEIGEQIRDVILDKDNVGMCGMTEALLYAAARAQLVSQVIRPNLDAGKIVICDRFADSSTVYQGYGRGLAEAVEAINAYAMMGCAPDLTFLLKVPPETGASRRANRSNDRIESEARAYHDAVYEAYMALERKHPGRIVGIDGTQEVGRISEIIKERLEEFLKGEG
ncbi:MAG: dTMP kinase [Clostridiales Family XIII bacterium]|jgi:dTMP kinase|nr:dTMP kinase [Clostridiales Family XIII bacterium]